MSAVRFDDIDVQDLSPRLRELVDVIGLAATVKLVNIRGGTWVYLPHAGQEQSVLADIVGADAAEQMIAHYGSARRLELDRGKRALAAVEKRAIVREAEKESATVLAIRYNRTERYIYAVLARAGKLDDKQLGLYP